MNAPITTPAPSAARARPDTPVMSLFREWLHCRHAHDQAYRETGEDDPAREIASDNMIAAERRIVDTASVSDRDWIAKISAASNFGLYDIDPELKRHIWAEARSLLDHPASESSQDQMNMQQLWLRYEELTAAIEKHEGDDDHQIHRAISAARDRVEENALARPCAAPGDFAIKMLMTHAGGAGITDDPVWDEARALALGHSSVTAPAPETPGPEVADSPSAADTAILRLFRLHTTIRAAAGEHLGVTKGADSPPELDEQLYQLTDAIEAEIMTLPSTCAADMAAKMIVAHSGGEQSCLPADAPVWIEAHKLAGVAP